jgi:hypothetical protein
VKAFWQQRESELNILSTSHQASSVAISLEICLVACLSLLVPVRHNLLKLGKFSDVLTRDYSCKSGWQHAPFYDNTGMELFISGTFGQLRDNTYRLVKVASGRTVRLCVACNECFNSTPLLAEHQAAF